MTLPPGMVGGPRCSAVLALLSLYLQTGAI